MFAKRTGLLVVTLIFLAGSLVGTAAAAEPPKAPASRLAFFDLNVTDLDRSLDFYTRVLGMREQRRIPLGNGITEVLLGFSNIDASTGIILIHQANRKERYNLGDAFARFVIEVPDIQALVARLAAEKISITRPPSHLDDLKITIAMAKDPDGYTIEFVQRD